MDNFSLFIDKFLSYFVTYAVFIVVVVAAFLIGFAMRKSKNAKTAVIEDTEEKVQEQA